MTTTAQSLPRSASGPYDYVTSSIDGPVGIVTLNRPKQLNALARPLLLELVDAIEQHDANSDIRVMVITGGTSVFAAGADIKEMADASSVDMLLRNNPGPLWDRLLAEAVGLGKQIAAKAPVAVRLAKASVTRAFEGRVDDGIELERDLFCL